MQILILSRSLSEARDSCLMISVFFIAAVFILNPFRYSGLMARTGDFGTDYDGITWPRRPVDPFVGPTHGHLSFILLAFHAIH